MTGGNISRAAQFAGRYRADFYKMLKKYGLHPSMLKERHDLDLAEIEDAAEELKDV
ncbi:MAG: hypothetical protein QM771_05170 [Nitrospira sp.]